MNKLIGILLLSRWFFVGLIMGLIAGDWLVVVFGAIVTIGEFYLEFLP